MAVQIEVNRVQRISWPDTKQLVSSLPILTILTLQTILSLSLRNTAFQDEALYLYAGRQYFDFLRGGPPVIEPYGQYFAGLPYFHPMIAGMLDIVGGLEAARLFSLVFMLLCTFCIFLLTRRLFDRESALVAAALFSVQGTVLYLGHFATFDAMCVSLLSVVTLLAFTGPNRRPVTAGFLAGLILAVAVAAKFAALLFMPSVAAILGWQMLRARGWWAALISSSLCALLAISGLAIPALLDNDVMVGLTHTTTERVAILAATRPELLIRAGTLAGGLGALALIGLSMAWRQRLVVSLILFGSTLLAPAYHIYKLEMVSLQKHVVFSLLFAAPLAGFAVARLSNRARGAFANRRWVLALAVCLLTFSIGMQQARTLFNEWPNIDPLLQTLLTQVRPSGRVLAEEMEVPRYYLKNVMSFWQWNQLYWFYYTDAKGQHLTGSDAYKAAIAEGYFDLVVLRYGPNAALDYDIDPGLKDGKRYDLIAKIPNSTFAGPGTYWVWRRRSDVQPASGGQTAVF